MGWQKWEKQLGLVLSTKSAEAVQEAVQVLEKHGCYVEWLNSGLYYSSTHTLTGCVPNIALCQLDTDIYISTNCMDYFHLL